MRGWALIGALAVLLAGCATAPADPTDPDLVTVVDEEMSTQILVRSAFMELTAPHTDVQRHRMRFFAGIDRSTRATVFLAEHEIRHRMGSWFFPSAVDYMAADGTIVSARSFKRQASEVQSCYSGGCTYLERSTFQLAEVELRALASREHSRAWKMRLISRLGYADATGDAGVLRPFLDRVDSIRQK